jgi:hypothetical protein
MREVGAELISAFCRDDEFWMEISCGEWGSTGRATGDVGYLRKLMWRLVRDGEVFY